MNLNPKKLFIFLTILIGLLFLFFNLFQVSRYWTDGDEPHYLTVTSSILKDFDLDLKNNYADGDYKTSHGTLIDQGHILKDRSGKDRPSHGILTPIMYVPGYFATNNAIGPKLTQLLLFFAFVAVLFKISGLILGQDFNKYILLIFISSPAALIFSTVLFPDIVQGLLILTGSYFLLKSLKDQLENQIYVNISLAGLFLGISIFAHYKSILYIFVLLVVYLALSIKRFRQINRSAVIRTILYTLPLWIPILVHMGITWIWYRSFAFSAIQYGTNNKTNLLQLLDNPFLGFAGQVFDYSYGIVWFFPLILIQLFGFGLWYKKHLQSFLVLAVPSFFMIFLNAWFYDWKAGFAPASRYLFPYLIILFPAFYYSFRSIYQFLWGKIVVYFFCFINFISIISLFPAPLTKYGYPSGSGVNYYWRWILETFHILRLEKFFMRLDFVNFSIQNNKTVLGIFVIIFFGLLIGINSIAVFKKTTKSPIQ